MKKLLAAGFVLAVFSVHAQKIKHTFNEEKQPAAPDYALESAWSSMPYFTDPADLTPIPEYKNGQDSALVDVFYVHPTTIDKSYGLWNASLEDEKINKRVDEWPVRQQASIFNGSCRVFAPRYRQANYEAFMALEIESSQQALELAYQDVKAAFEYYLEHHNGGRPFIVASHSQGTFHSMRLIKEMIDNTPLMQKMLAAYLVGMPVHESNYETCKVCEDETSVNCFVSWNTMKRKSYPQYYDEYYTGAICVNPLTWSCDPEYADEECHVGGVPAKFNRTFSNQYGARVKDYVLWIDPVNLPGIPFTKLKKNWHIGDYNLFYGNIRQNVAVRIENYFQQNPTEWQIANSVSDPKSNILNSDSE